ncbi:MAG: hypothetical protein ACSHX6_03540 [Akkermansiaceae bacterium]
MILIIFLVIIRLVDALNASPAPEPSSVALLGGDMIVITEKYDGN